MTFDEWATQYELGLNDRDTCYSAWCEAIAAEREACAKVCDDLHHKWHWGDGSQESGPHECAAAIRTRSNAPGNKPPSRADD